MHAVAGAVLLNPFITEIIVPTYVLLYFHKSAVCIEQANVFGVYHAFCRIGGSSMQLVCCSSNYHLLYLRRKSTSNSFRGLQTCVPATQPR